MKNLKDCIVGSTVILTAIFKNRLNQLSDLESLKMTTFLEKGVKLEDTKQLDLLSHRVSAGTYEVVYTIPDNIDTDVFKSMTVVFEGKRGEIVQKTAVTIPISWRSFP